MSTISIIGAGNMAAALGGLAVKAGHTVEVIARDEAKARALADRLGPGVTTAAYGSVPTGEVVILSVLFAAATDVVSDFGDALAGKVVVDITNPFDAEATGLAVPAGTSVAQEVAKVAPEGTHVLKAFNTVFGHVMARTTDLDVFVAGDDAQAKATLSGFIESIGMRPLDVGDLAMAGRLESAGILLMGLARNNTDGFDIALKIDHA